MALNSYLKQTQRLLRDVKHAAFVPEDIVDWINIARGQVAGEGECIRAQGKISTVVGAIVYAFSGINTATLGPAGVQGVINVRSVRYLIETTIGFSPAQRVEPRAWEWFERYQISNPVFTAGAPQQWAQYGQGASGSFFVWPPPDLVYSLLLDCVCYPVPLVDDTTVEALPYFWTDAVPFYAAYYGYLSLQRAEEAARMFATYQEFVKRAREFANPSTTRHLYAQAKDPVEVSRLGLVQRGN